MGNTPIELILHEVMREGLNQWQPRWRWGWGKMGRDAHQGLFTEKGLIDMRLEGRIWGYWAATLGSNMRKQIAWSVVGVWYDIKDVDTGSGRSEGWGEVEEGEVLEWVSHAKKTKERHKQICMLRMTTLAPLWRLDGKKARLGKSDQLGDHWS